MVVPPIHVPGGRCAALRPEPPRHAEVDNERLAGRERSQQVFPATAERCDALAAEAACEAGGEGAPEIRSMQNHAIESRPVHRAQQTAPDALDFRKLRHYPRDAA
jgi:hypothetical protein